MRRLLLASAIALLPLSAHADPKTTVDSGIQAVIGALHTAAEATFGKADPWLQAHVWPYTGYAACEVFNNPYAQRAFDASEAKNQPAPIACVKP